MGKIPSAAEAILVEQSIQAWKVISRRKQALRNSSHSIVTCGPQRYKCSSRCQRSRQYFDSTTPKGASVGSSHVLESLKAMRIFIAVHFGGQHVEVCRMAADHGPIAMETQEILEGPSRLLAGPLRHLERKRASAMHRSYCIVRGFIC